MKMYKMILIIIISTIAACNSGEDSGANVDGLACQEFAGSYTADGRSGLTTDLQADCTFYDNYCEQNGTLEPVDPENGVYQLTVSGGNLNHGCYVDAIDFGEMSALCEIAQSGLSFDIDCPSEAYFDYVLVELL